MKKIFAIVISISLLFVFTACTSSNMNGNGNDNSNMNPSEILGENSLNPSTPSSNQSNGKGVAQAKLSYDEAKAAALKDAQLNMDDVRFVRCELDRDDGVLKYEVEFTKDNVEYEYDINADTGEILWVDKDYD